MAANWLALMDIVLVRVDNRLVHGQILEAWVPYVKADCIVVVDDNVASDFFRETVIKMAVPREIDVIITSVEDFTRYYIDDSHNDKRTIVLFSEVVDVVTCFKHGFKFGHLNIGNVYNEDCVKECSPSVLLGTRDIESIEYLLATGIKVELQRIPRERPTNIAEFMVSVRPQTLSR
jgi:mannose/fructose/N-acetylgalactosamine-specific phosphotransferase system component IIB